MLIRNSINEDLEVNKKQGKCIQEKGSATVKGSLVFGFWS